MEKELKELSDELMSSVKLVKKSIREINDNCKGTLSPNELESLTNAAKFLKYVNESCCDEGDWGESYGYSMRAPRHYDVRMDSYGDDMGYSERRGRSPVTGRYISRGIDHMDGMSGHSIEDRMIAALEDQMDAAKNEYERQIIKDEIKRIRNGSR